MTFKELLLDEWNITEGKLDWLLRITSGSDYHNELLAERWHSTRRETEKEIKDFYRDNIINSRSILHRLPLDSEISLDCFQPDCTEIANFLDKAGSESKAVLHLLDFGAGFGNNGFYAHQHGYTVTFVEIESPHYYIIKRIIQHVQSKRLFLTTEMPNRFFDLIISMQVMEHLKNPLKYLAKFYTHLFDEGYLIMDCFFDDCQGKAPYHLHENNVFGDTKYWYRCVKQIGFQPVLQQDKILVWKKLCKS